MQASLEDEYLAALQALNPGGLADYARKLRRNAGNPRGVYDLLAEGRAALMFLRNGWHVEMRERPDLMLERDGDIIYAEVKHFHRKLQDELDEQVMNAETYDDLDDLLIPVGDTMELEGVPPWRQVANVAVKKMSQYVENACNILVVVSSSESLEMMAATAVHDYNDECGRTRNPALRKLNGVMLVNTRSLTLVGGYSNVEFEPTQYPTRPLSSGALRALTDIRTG